jgi:uncharacterized RDD family membrane protein YckC
VVTSFTVTLEAHDGGIHQAEHRQTGASRTTSMNTENLEYVGFWARVGAACIDILLQLAITAPLTYAIYGHYTSSGFNFMGPADLLINFVLPATAVIALWMRFGATPGKMALSARIVDADTGETLTAGMSLIRYLGYFVAMLPFFVGFIWIGFDRRKQGWHDKLANSVVIRPAGTAQVRFTAKKDWREGSGGSVASDPTL